MAVRYWALRLRNATSADLEAHAAVAEYLEIFYNTQRRHSLLGYLSPEENATKRPSAEIEGL